MVNSIIAGIRPARIAKFSLSGNVGRMDPKDLERILDEVNNGTLSTDEAMQRLRDLPFSDLGFARVDHHRHMRTGIPEIVFCQGKSARQIKAIAESMLENAHGVLLSRIDQEQADFIKKHFDNAQHHADARVCVIGENTAGTEETAAVVSAGTSDLPVAEEAALTAEFLGLRVERVYDAGVAGIHRLLPHLEMLNRARVLIVVAGMEGALPSVVAGLVGRPVIAVPTSVGYGASFGGLAALLGMLNSCSPGVTVVNIDNGVGAAAAAALIAKK